MTGTLALDLPSGEDVFWCTADPGWVTGTSYGIIAPLTNGVTSIVDEADFDAERWYEFSSATRVTVWYTAPTAIRMLMKAGSGAGRRRDLPALRFIASVGEPLNPEAVLWGVGSFGIPFHDNWWQTETGGIMIANLRRLDIKPGLDGPAAARHRSGDRAARRGRAAPHGGRGLRQLQGELALRAAGRRCSADISTRRSAIGSVSPRW